jgi:hypothetical protein
VDRYVGRGKNLKYDKRSIKEPENYGKSLCDHPVLPRQTNLARLRLPDMKNTLDRTRYGADLDPKFQEKLHGHSLPEAFG